MLFWLICAVLTAVVTAVTLRPLVVREAGAVIPDHHDLHVYKEQLAEVDRDIARGLLTSEEAKAARLEVSRRILAAESVSSALPDQPIAGPSGFSQVVIYLTMALIVTGSLGLYLLRGAPGYDAQPFAGRAASRPENAPVDELIARVEARLRESPSDAQGWDVLAPVYLKQQRYPDAIRAYGQAIALAGESRARLSGLAEAHLADSNGIVGEEVRAAYTKILAKEPQLMAPRFWLAVGLEQDGDKVGAAAAFRALLSGAGGATTALPPTLLQLIQERLQALTSDTASKAPLPEAGKGPSLLPGMAEGMTAKSQAEMIEQMVGGLAKRLDSGGGRVDEWQRLMRAYVVMGRRPEASEAFAKARRQFESDATARKQLEIFARELGLDPG